MSIDVMIERLNESLEQLRAHIKRAANNRDAYIVGKGQVYLADETNPHRTTSDPLAAVVFSREHAKALAATRQDYQGRQYEPIVLLDAVEADLVRLPRVIKKLEDMRGL